ncbi:type V toxin-antitoxin system endoribonuclease antitoxin GhoS [Pantoea sp. KPR_PJ]|uniref:type V toxin-antitoxin system endoribonuclease antitoxin GhoS n=1 Tax=Pantoea sp. KPR_PJ TaxID=2738375 RepID=UPI0035298925
MSGNVNRYVVTFSYEESGLSDVQRLNSAMVAAGFTTTLHDDEGKAHPLATNSFGLVSALSPDDLQQQAVAAGESVLHQKPEVNVTTLEAYLHDASR